MRYLTILLWIASLVAVPTVAAAQNAAEQATIGHATALEELAARPLEEAVAEFEANRFGESFKAQTTAEGRRSLLAEIRAIAEASGGVALMGDVDGVTMVFDGADRTRTVRFTPEAEAPYGIASLEILEPEAPMVLTLATLEQQVDDFVAEAGGHGLVFVMRDGEILLEKGYGMANAAMGTPITAETVFDTGSRPIDYTVAAILLLAQQGRLSRSDTLADHFEGVPADRAGITIEQLMTGRSGFPDFPANDSDWDSDLGWIDRTEFERRSWAVPLLFEPGSQDVHSHWAFGLLAAIVERVGGQPYAAFLRQNFFDPAGMTRTGDYGDALGLNVTDFAEGHGNQRGLPNIPPNWGPTSWLVLGSGGMVSTLGDLQRFYAYLLSGAVLDEEHQSWFADRRAQLDGTDRGTELFSFNTPDYRTQAYIFLTSGGPGHMRRIIRPMIDLLAPRPPENSGG